MTAWVRASVLLPGDSVTLAAAWTRDNPRVGVVTESVGPRLMVSWPGQYEAQHATLSDLAVRAPGAVTVRCQFCHRFSPHADGTPAPSWPRRDLCGDCARIRRDTGTVVMARSAEIEATIVQLRASGQGALVLHVPRAGGTLDGARCFGLIMVEADITEPAVMAAPPAHPAETPPAAVLPSGVEQFLRGVARPAGTPIEQLAIDAAGLLVQLGATCEAAHIGPYFRVIGSDSLERCLTCGEVSGK